MNQLSNDDVFFVKYRKKRKTRVDYEPSNHYLVIDTEFQ